MTHPTPLPTPLSATLSTLAMNARMRTNTHFQQHQDIATPEADADNAYCRHLARVFLQDSCPEFLTKDSPSWKLNLEDRLLKIGRSVRNLLDVTSMDKEPTLEKSLTGVVTQSRGLAVDTVSVPKVRFGKTNLQMPIVTLGCMRFQQTWANTVTDMSQVNTHIQDNLINILRYAITELGITHIETARQYGCSDLQIGAALKVLMQTQEVQRQDLILQSKVNPMPKDQFKETLDTTLRNLGVEYLDLVSFHGINMESQIEEIFGSGNNGQVVTNADDGGLLQIVREYQALGKIKHVGFSTHGRVDLTKRMILTGEFDYLNLHYHWCGSYTASGEGTEGVGNWECIRLAKGMDMGVFVISPYDKGGRLYAPSQKLRTLTLPEYEPMTFGSLWLWNHEHIIDTNAPIHTIVCGAARPSDLDEPAYAAHLHGSQPTSAICRNLQSILTRLHQAQVHVLGQDWVNSWYVGLPNCATEQDAYQLRQMVWMFNLIKAWGMLEYAKERYEIFDGNLKQWDFSLSTKDNIQKRRIWWGYCPGIAMEAKKDYTKYLGEVPDVNKAKVIEALSFTHDYCSKESEFPELHVPEEWKTAYDMRPWTAYPEQR